MDANVYQHFRREEHAFIDSAQDSIEQSLSQYAPILTDFLDPRQAFILESLIRQESDLKFRFFGGYEAAERRRCLIFPDYYQAVQEDFEIELYQIHYPKKFAVLSHGKVLGSLIGTGIDRQYIGDIISDGEEWQVFLAKEVSHYIQLQLTKIGNVKVRMEEQNYTEILLPKDGWTPESTTTSSLRLDNVVAAVFNISRQRSKQMIETGRVKVNWTPTERPDFVLDLLDIVSIRGFGRLQIQGLEGTTKKGKIRLSLGVLRK